MRFLVGLAFILLTGCASTSKFQNTDVRGVPPSSSTNPEREIAVANVTAAIQRHDYRQAIALQNDWAKRFPTDLDFRHFQPALYLMAGDRDGWENTRGDLLQRWRRIREAGAAPANPSFTVDVIKVGQDTVIADQCYERAGRFGVIYRFTVVSVDKQVRSFFTVESPDSDNKIARELGRTEQVFTLDHFRPGIHETVAMLPGLPPYEDIRRRVINYIGNPQPISASGNGQGGLSTENCSIKVN